MIKPVPTYYCFFLIANLKCIHGLQGYSIPIQEQFGALAMGDMNRLFAVGDARIEL